MEVEEDAKQSKTSSPTLPSLRELELEVLLQTREREILSLRAEVKTLESKLVNISSTVDQDDPKHLVLVSALLPRLLQTNSSAGAASGSPLNDAVQTRAKLLQEENDELYAVLRRAETGRLDEEVKGLRRIVGKLTRSLQASNQNVKYLSDELERTTELLSKVEASSSRAPSRMDDLPITPPTAPRHHLHHPSPHPSTSSAGKPIPTAPRAYKRPRTNDHPTATTPRLNGGVSKNGNTSRDRDITPMEVDDRKDRDHERDRDSEREKDRQAREQRFERDRERDREREREKEQRLERDRERDREKEQEKERRRERDRERRETRDSQPREKESQSREKEREKESTSSSSGLRIRGVATGGSGRSSSVTGSATGGRDKDKDRDRDSRRAPRQNGSGHRSGGGGGGDRGLVERLGL